ncbi:hypothetical protein POV27_06955 [Aureisphaera galaxeae]|uniref:hypothetical protein n=1 Tax=Aureisphaera galaxeae TaxID=1538023 RepID=UPI00234FFB02|nr:hypothetical protein [Aureisphaera galaxeae]MDC8003783.1 hypothetical protein [Aureisphaera galaxeae]
MKKAKQAYRFVEWSSPDELHEATLEWKSELEFIKVEQRFLNQLIANHTLELISKEIRKESQELISELYKEEKEVDGLFDDVLKHSNRLEILVDGVDQIQEEKQFKEAHYFLKMEVLSYLNNYKETKRKIFLLIQQIMKKKKRKQISG